MRELSTYKNNADTNNWAQLHACNKLYLEVLRCKGNNSYPQNMLYTDNNTTKTTIISCLLLHSSVVIYVCFRYEAPLFRVENHHETGGVVSTNMAMFTATAKKTYSLKSTILHLNAGGCQKKGMHRNPKCTKRRHYV
jgi:hypothetical protein